MVSDKAQRYDQLRGLVSQARRPILTHLNADSSWLMSFPCPPSGTDDAESTGKAYFHLLVDAWLTDRHIDAASWISTEYRVVPCAVSTIAEVEELIAVMEDAAAPAADGQHENGTTKRPSIDAVLVSHTATDHMNKETLLQVDPSVPVITVSGPEKPAPKIKSWKHFENVTVMPDFTSEIGNDWRRASTSPLPPWLAVFRLPSKEKSPALHFAIAIAFSSKASSPPTAEAEAVIYSPHGLGPEDMEPLTAAKTPITTLALLHGLHERFYPVAAALGAHNGIRMQKETGAKYWVRTHDEEVKNAGIMSYFMKRNKFTFEDALSNQGMEDGEGGGTDSDGVRPLCFDVENGASLLLE